MNQKEEMDTFELLLPEMTREELEERLREYYKLNLELRERLIELEPVILHKNG
jgi:hypothetical protein